MSNETAEERTASALERIATAGRTSYWTAGVSGVGAIILRDGVPISIGGVLNALNEPEEYRASRRRDDEVLRKCAADFLRGIEAMREAAMAICHDEMRHGASHAGDPRYTGRSDGAEACLLEIKHLVVEDQTNAE